MSAVRVDRRAGPGRIARRSLPDHATDGPPRRARASRAWPRPGGPAACAPAVLLLWALMAGPAAAQEAGVVVPLPQGSIFTPLLADPKTPRFETAVVGQRSPSHDTTMWVVAFGETFGLVRWPGVREDDGVQLEIAGAVFAQFDLGTASSDLINADYVIGLPLGVRRGHWSGRARLYHQSSHLGDEFLLSTQPTPARVNLSFESIELLAAYEARGWRLYGGGEVLVRREPDDFSRRAAHVGLEVRPAAHLAVGSRGVGHVVAAVDVRFWEHHDWSPATSAKAGLELSPAGGAAHTRRWSLLAQFYDGPSPYGQFYRLDVRYVGAGVQFSF